MSGLNLLTIQDEISTYISEQFPSYQVHEDFILDDEQIIKSGNKTKPYIVLTWSGLGHSTSNASFGGVRHDEYFSSFEVGVVAPTPKQCRRALNIILDKLIGWSPASSEHLVPIGGGGTYVAVERGGKPELYISTGSLSFPVNGNRVASYITA
jgi:hypothetical protein